MVTVAIHGFKLGEKQPLFYIGGPCVIEGLTQALKHARAIAEICGGLGIPFIYKTSYDKANRTSHKSFRGPGLKKGLEILRRVKAEVKVPILTDVHDVSEVKSVARVADVVQIPAFLCRQTELVKAAAATGRVVNIKKGQFMDPWA
ncbi:MAG: 3-deoxy-8-phosphooctulonate synthase, partial [Planctomycetota bacterium]